ncbi:MAG: (2Fe-2S) ferredoxin domain-containing protein [Sulfurifustis sp.]
MSYYERHVFFCCNQRSEGELCCASFGAQRVRDYAKQRLRALDRLGPGKIRINQAGCMDRCQDGPVIAVYPEGVWYTYVDEDDVDAIIEEHLLNGRQVERLRLADTPPQDGE